MRTFSVRIFYLHTCIFFPFQATIFTMEFFRRLRLSERGRFMKKVLIIGGGVAALTSGIFLLKKGFSCEIFEQSGYAGGNLTGWNRSGYHIDNCIHWLTGTNKSTDMYKLWEEIGALGSRIPIYQSDAFYSSEGERYTIHYYRDSERARREMLLLSPKDKIEINRFFNAVGTFAKEIQSGGDPINRIKQLYNYARYAPMSLCELSKKFKNELIAKSMTDFIGGEFSSLALIIAYGTYVANNGGIPFGGSREMAGRIITRFKRLGGRIHLSAKVEKIVCDNGTARGIVLKNGNYISGDYVIAACDPKVTFNGLLPRKSMPSAMVATYKKRSAFPVFSAFQVAIGADTDTLPIKGTTAFPISPIISDERCVSRLTVREFSYEPRFLPHGKSLIECMIFQHEKSCRKWIELKSRNPELYNREKGEHAKLILSRIEERYPTLRGKLSVIDVWTPATYNERFDSYCGAFLGFAVTGKAIPRASQIRPKGFSNIVLSGQWLKAPGGLSTAALTGKKAAEKIISLESKAY